MSLTNIINELIVTKIESSIGFYEKNFGFTTEFTDGNPINWAQIKKDGFVLMLEEYETFKCEIEKCPPKTNNSNIIKLEYSSIEEIKELYNRLKANEIEFFMEYTETDYGKTEFGVFDPDKNMILVSVLMK